MGIIYRHSGYDFSEFHQSIIDNIYKLNQSQNKFIICRDINIDLLKYGKGLRINSMLMKSLVLDASSLLISQQN